MNGVIVLDLGGTLMEFVGMPRSWCDYYFTGFNHVNQKYGLNLGAEELETAVKIMTEYNPRVNYREDEVLPEIVFQNATKSWNCCINVDDVIKAFFEGLNLNAVIYDYTFELIDAFHQREYKVACLTDIPNGMPDAFFRESIKPLISHLDLYVSSQSCGFRKPNPFGLHFIADFFGVGINDLLFIGDEEKDKLTAERANCEFAFISDYLHLTEKDKQPIVP